MASIVRDFAVDADLDTAWDRLADPAAVNKLITFLGDVTVEGDNRTCELGEAGVLRELIVAIDPEQRRIAYSIKEAPFPLTHHHASMQVLSEGDETRFRWVTDFKPDELTETMESVVDDAVGAIEAALSS